MMNYLKPPFCREDLNMRGFILHLNPLGQRLSTYMRHLYEVKVTSIVTS